MIPEQMYEGYSPYPDGAYPIMQAPMHFEMPYGAVHPVPYNAYTGYPMQAYPMPQPTQLAPHELTDDMYQKGFSQGVILYNDTTFAADQKKSIIASAKTSYDPFSQGLVYGFRHAQEAAQTA